MNKISLKEVNKTIELLKNYEKEVNFSPQEYIDRLMRNETNKIYNNSAKIFLLLKKNERILECITENYSMAYKTDTNDMILLKIIIYLIIFEITGGKTFKLIVISEGNYKSIKEIFKALNISTCINLMKFLNREEFLIITTEASCSVYDNDYVLNSIIKPLINRTKLIEDLQHELIEKAAEKTRPVVKLPTKARSPKFNFKRSSIEKPLSTEVSKTVVEQVENKTTFKKKEIPSTTYYEDNRIKKKIEAARENNRTAALNLLKQANTKPFRCSKSETHLSSMPTEKTTSGQKIKAHKVPKFKPVDVKNNTTALMRQAALFVKAQEKEIKKLEALTSGAFDDAVFEEWEEEERKRIQQEDIQTIEKKHLQGLMTHEEALLAKQNLLQLTKQKAQEVKYEKEQLNRALEEWKKEQQEKLKEQVEKTQITHNAFKKSERKIQEEKFYNARMLELESKRLLEEAFAKQREELSKKVELIKEIKAIQLFKDVHRKEFDPTETPNLGLMCEMSIAELQERLGLVKLELHEEIESKRKAINESRQQKKDLLQCVQEFIEVNKNERKINKEKKIKKSDVKLEETEEIQAMKNKLCELRKKRLKNILDN